VRDDARVAVLQDDEKTCGFLAFQAGGDGDGSPIGATICDAQAVIGAPGWMFDARDLIGAAGLRRWQFDHMVTAQRPFVPFHRELHRSPLIDLRNGHDRFLEEVRGHSKDLLAQVRRRRRNLERDVGPVGIEWQSAHYEHDMRTLQSWKSDQYGRTGTWDRFAHPWIMEAISRLGRSSDPSCVGVLTVLRAGDRTVATHLGLRGTDRLSWWFPAYDPEFGRYSPGLILLLELVAEAARRGIPRVDLGRGEHDYKRRVTGHFYEVAEGEVTADGA
jgi:CelD/BcsL family acetyltransferase involved in cellulose biosynthesis